MRWAGSRVELAVLGTGIALRLTYLLRDRPIWLDEAWLALNILTRPLSGFFRPLDDQQMSSLGFLSAEWLVTRLAGPGELALRAIPFIAGALALIAFARLARRLLDPGPALVATALAALSPLLIHYSTETKSYGFDALMAILLMHATLDLAEPGVTRQAFLRWSLVAAVTALFSVPAPFIVAGCALALLLVPRFRRSRDALVSLACAAGPAAACFLIQLLTLYHSQKVTGSMQAAWTAYFPAPGLIGALKGGWLAAKGLLDTLLFGTSPLNWTRTFPLPPRTLLVMILLTGAGAVSLARRSGFHLALLLAPSLLAFCGSLARYWPLSPRLLLFAAPLVLITVPAGLQAVANLAPGKARARLFAGAAAILLAVTATAAAIRLVRPSGSYGLPKALAHIAAHHHQGATIYVAAHEVPACRYYSAWHPNRYRLIGDSLATECSISGGRIVAGTWPTWDKKATAETWAREERRRILDGGSGEVWLIVRPAWDPVELVAAIDSTGARRVGETRSSNLTVYEYRTSPRAPAP